MTKKLLRLGTMMAVALAAIIAACDALITTDAERLDEFVDAVTGEVSTGRIDHALRYADPGREPLEVVMVDDVEVYTEGDELALTERARDILAPFSGDDVRLVQEHVEIDESSGADARVALRLGTRAGIVDVTFQLRRHGDEWLVHRVRVT
jgi:hypothetical protein